MGVLLADRQNAHVSDADVLVAEPEIDDARLGDRTNRRTGEHTRAKPRALPARPRPCHPAHTRPIVLSNDPPNAGAAAKIFFCSRAPFARPVVRRGPAHPTPTPAPPPRALRPNPVAGASFPTSRLRAQRRGSIGRRSKPPRLRDRAEHRDDFCLLGAHPAEHAALVRAAPSHPYLWARTSDGERGRGGCGWAFSRVGRCSGEGGGGGL